MEDRGCQDLRSLQDELLLRPAPSQFHERLLRHLGCMGVWLGSVPNEAAAKVLSITGATFSHRSQLQAFIVRAKTALAVLPRRKGTPSPEQAEARLRVQRLVSQEQTLTLGIQQLLQRGVTKVHQLLGSASGGLLPLAAVPGRGGLNGEAYQALLSILETVPLETRIAMYQGNQPDI